MPRGRSSENDYEGPAPATTSGSIESQASRRSDAANDKLLAYARTLGINPDSRPMQDFTLQTVLGKNGGFFTPVTLKTGFNQDKSKAKPGDPGTPAWWHKQGIGYRDKATGAYLVPNEALHAWQGNATNQFNSQEANHGLETAAKFMPMAVGAAALGAAAAPVAGAGGAGAGAGAGAAEGLGAGVAAEGLGAGAFDAAGVGALGSADAVAAGLGGITAPGAVGAGGAGAIGSNVIDPSFLAELGGYATPEAGAIGAGSGTVAGTVPTGFEGLTPYDLGQEALPWTTNPSVADLGGMIDPATGMPVSTGTLPNLPNTPPTSVPGTGTGTGTPPGTGPINTGPGGTTFDPTTGTDIITDTTPGPGTPTIPGLPSWFTGLPQSVQTALLNSLGGGTGTGTGTGTGMNIGNWLGAISGLYTLFNRNQGTIDPARLDAMWNAGMGTYNTALDPQNALRDRTQQRVVDATRAGQSARGIAMTPYAAGGESDAVKNFNLDWENNALGRRVQGTKALTDAGRGTFDATLNNGQIQQGNTAGGIDAIMTALQPWLQTIQPGDWLSGMWGASNPQASVDMLQGWQQDGNNAANGGGYSPFPMGAS